MNAHNTFYHSKIPTNQKFGWFFTAMLFMVAVFFYGKSWDAFAITALIIGLLLAAATLLAPQLLTPFNRLWFRFGLLLGKISSPIVLGIIFLLLIIPISLLIRLIKRDELKLKKQIVESFWVDRSPPGPFSDSFKNQF